MPARARFLLAALLSISLVWSQTFALVSPVRAAPAGTDGRGTAAAGLSREAVDRQLRLFRAFAGMRARLDRSGFDPAALAHRFADWREAFAFVRDHIALLPYRGILRFADGTLASRAGSSCDRALLLAELLRAMGHGVRFATGRLDDAATDRLRRTIDRPPTAESRPLAVDPPDPALEAAVVEAGLPVEAWRQALEETRRETAALLGGFARDLAATRAELARLFPPASGDAGGGAAEDAVRAALAEHCWVELRTAEGWLDLDPTPGLEPGRTLTVADRVGEEPDPALKPSLEVRLLVHRRQGGRRESAEVLVARAFPDSGLWTAQLAVIPEIRGPFMLQRLAEGALREGFDVHVAVLRTKGARIVGEPFDLTGRILETDFDARNARRLGETTGGLFGRALGALNEALGEGAAPEEEPFVFDGLELRLLLRLPDGRTREARRLLVGPAPAEILRRGLMLTAEIAVSAARMPRGRLLAETLETVLAARPLWTAAVSGADPLRTEMTARRVYAVSSDLLAFLQLRSALREYVMAEVFPELVAVPDGPLVVMRLGRLRADAGEVRLVRGFDLVFDGVRVVPREPGVGGDPTAAVRLLWTVDNVLEHVLAGPATRSGVALLRAAADEGVGLRVVSGTDALAGLGHIPAYARGLIEEQLAQGRLVALPAGPLEGGRFGFWTFDPATGAVHGFGADGTGQAMTEYGEQISDVAVLVFASAVSCATSALVFGGMDFKDYALCLAIGIVVGGLVNLAVARLAKRFGWGQMTSAGVGGAADAVASGYAGRALGGHGAASGEPPMPPLAGEAGAVAGGRGSALSPSAVSRALTEAASSRPVATAREVGAGPHGGPRRGGAISVPNEPLAGGVTARRAAIPPSRATTAGGSGAGGAAGGLAALGGALRRGAPGTGTGTAAGEAASSAATRAARPSGAEAGPAARGSGGAGEGSSQAAARPRTSTESGTPAERAARASEGLSRGRPAGDGQTDLRTVDPEGPKLATPTPEPLEVAKTEITETMRRIRPQPGDTPEQVAAKARFRQAVEAAEEMNLSWTHIGQLRSMAKAYDSVIVTRGVNRHAYRWYREGAVGKNIFMKGKSADRGAIAGLIPENQAYSKLYGKVEQARKALHEARTPADRAKARQKLEEAWKKIEEYNTKVREGVKEAGYKFVQFEVDGNPVNVYRKGNEIYQAYEKGGRLYDATTRKPLPGSARDYARVEPLRVVGIEETDPGTGTKRTRYVTADVDLDAVVTGPYAPKEPVVAWRPKTGDPFGNRTPRTEAMLRGMRNVAEASGDHPLASHGPESLNPAPAGIPLSDFPRLAVFPDGSTRVLRNPYDVWKLYSDLKKAGWNVDLSPKYLKEAGWIPKSVPDDAPTVPPWWERPPEAVKEWIPRQPERPRPRRRRSGRATPPCAAAPHRRRRSSCTALPRAA